MSAPLVTLEEARDVCGQKFVEQRRRDLETLLLRAYGGAPRHVHYHNAVSLHFPTMRKLFGQAAVPRIRRRYFERRGAHLTGKWTAAFRLNPSTAQRVERHLLADDPLSRKPFSPVARPVGDTGLSFPDLLSVDLAHLEGLLDAVRELLKRHGEDFYYAASLASSQNLGALYRQLLALRRTVIERGGLPNEYEQTAGGRWGGSHDHHVLRLPRTTRYLALGPRPDLWDVDIANAHLAIALGLVGTWFPEEATPTLRAYLQHRSEWLDVLCRALPGVTLNDAKGVARAWLYGSRRTNAGSTNAVISSPLFPGVLERFSMWGRLYSELRRVSELLLTVEAEPPLPSETREGTRLSYLLTQWETRIMTRLGQKLLQDGVKLEAWLYDGFLLIQSRTDPTERIEALLGEVSACLKAEGHHFEPLGLKVRSVARLFSDVRACLDAPRINPAVLPNGSL